MILERLTLRNFGLFRGEQVFNLAPAQGNGRGRPIVLFGGINGGGKTTLFDALQFALYGPRARCSKRASLSYDDFLRQSIHHGVPPTKGPPSPCRSTTPPTVSRTTTRSAAAGRSRAAGPGKTWW